MPVDARQGFLALRLPVASYTGGNDFCTLVLEKDGKPTDEARALSAALHRIDGDALTVLDERIAEGTRRAWHERRLAEARRHAAENPELVDDHSDADPGL